MGVFGGPKVITNNLSLNVDAANFKSFRGVPTTNLLPSPSVNAFPTASNSWGTYNTNQYGSGNFFSIGTVSSVTSNIVTMTSNHSLRSYDVMRPQTTGGGVTANTDYLIKKISNTQFSLHEYNSSQDGSQGFVNPSTGNHKVYDAFTNDTRISINSTNFPTMWWGAPHLPNSGLVKELIGNGFSNVIPGINSSCIRLHYIRSDDVKDGMSYGVDATVTPSTNHTISFYTRSPDDRAVGKVIQYYIYNYTGGNASTYAWNFTLGPVGVWERQSFTYSPAHGTMISYWFPQSNGVYSWDWACMQIESGSVATPFIPGTRGATVATGGGWEDISANTNHGQLINNLIYSSSVSENIRFDGVDDYISITNSTSLQVGATFTISAWVKATNLNSRYGIFSTRIANTTGCWQLEVGTANGGTGRIAVTGIGTWIWESASNVISPNTWYHICFTRASNSEIGNLYLNGQLLTPITTTAYTILNNNDVKVIGAGTLNTQYFPGSISTVSLYNRALSVNEVLQNFNATRSRFGI